MNTEINNRDNDEISLKELIEKGKEWYSYLLSQWKIIVLAGIIGGSRTDLFVYQNQYIRQLCLLL
jgi:hypothetical protein